MANPQRAALRTVRGLHYHLDGAAEGTQIPAQIRGVVVNKWSRGVTAGGWILELTGKANVIVNRHDATIDLSELQVGRRVIVTGSAAISSRRQLVIHPDRLDVLSIDAIGKERSTSPSAEVPSHIRTSFLLSRLRSIASASATRLGYREFEPYYVSTPLLERASEPLSVSFEGWGSPLSLAVSPAPQLLQILFDTGEQRVFAVARCFSSAYRDGYSSAEELTLVARQIDTSLNDVILFAETVLRELLHEGDTAVERVPWGTDRWPIAAVAEFEDVEVGAPRIEWTRVTNQGVNIPHSVFRVVYPQGIVAAEGDVTEWAQGVRIGGVTVHLERIVPLLSPTRLDTIRDLSTSQ